MSLAHQDLSAMDTLDEGTNPATQTAGEEPSVDIEMSTVEHPPNPGHEVGAIGELMQQICRSASGDVLGNIGLASRRHFDMSRVLWAEQVRVTAWRILQYLTAKPAPPEGKEPGRPFASHLSEAKSLIVDFGRTDGAELGLLACLVDRSGIRPRTLTVRGDTTYTLTDRPTTDMLDILQTAFADVEALEVVTSSHAVDTIALWMALCDHNGKLKHVRVSPDYTFIQAVHSRESHPILTKLHTFGYAQANEAWGTASPAHPWVWNCKRLVLGWDGSDGVMSCILRWIPLGVVCALTHLYVDRLVYVTDQNSGNASFRDFLDMVTPTLEELGIGDITEVGALSYAPSG
jgi:hypothetical protein